MEEAAEELEVVREDENSAGDEREEPERPRQCRADADGDGAADRAEREPQSMALGSGSRAGGPGLVQCMRPDPGARKNAASAASRRFVSSSGASAAPIAT